MPKLKAEARNIRRRPERFVSVPQRGTGELKLLKKEGGLTSCPATLGIDGVELRFLLPLEDPAGGITSR